MSSEEESKWMERRRKVLKKLRGKKMSRRGGTQWIDTASATTDTSSHRSSVAGSLCSWDTSTEQAINVGLMGYETAIIEEAEEEEEISEPVLEPEQQPHSGSDISEIRGEPAPLSDAKSELSRYTGSLVSRDDDRSELGTLSTDVDSTVDGHSAVEVFFDHVDLHLDSKSYSDGQTSPDRASFSTIGSGYDVVIDHHRDGVWFASGTAELARSADAAQSSVARLLSIPDKRPVMAASLSESSMGSF
jgi:hypothetical protein